jgi:8-oxo-dGTP pyrophosphatase MutT (NUDIX family)
MKIAYQSVFSTPYFTVEASKDYFIDNNPYYRLLAKDSVICMILNSRDEVILVKQFRPNLSYETLELPAGSIELGETSEDAAFREALEETGFHCKFKFIGSYRLLMNRDVNMEHLFIGFVDESKPNEISNIKVEYVSRKSFYTYIKKNKFEQLAAFGLVELINDKYNINFFKDEKVVDKIWRADENC